MDDERDAADTLSVLLDLTGFTTKVCYDGRSALAAVDAFQPDICILDLSMPEMSGLELGRRLREWSGDRDPPLVLVALTGRNEDEARRRTTEIGFDLHLTKPVEPDVLAVLLADVVILRGASPPVPAASPSCPG